MGRFQFESSPTLLRLAAKIELSLWNWRERETEREREGERERGDERITIQGDLNDSFCAKLQGWLSEYEQAASEANFIHG